MLNVSRFSHLFKTISCIKYCRKPPSYFCSQQYNLIIQRNFYRKAYRYFFPTSQDMKLRDKVSSDHKLIYVGYSMNTVFYGYRFLVGITTLSALNLVISELFGRHTVLAYIFYPEYYFNFFVVTAYIVGILTWAHLVSKPYVYRIYYSESKNKYLAVLMGRHPFESKKLELEPKSMVQVRPTDKHYMFPMRNHMYKTPSNEIVHFNYSRFENMFFYCNLVKDSDYL